MRRNIRMKPKIRHRSAAELVCCLVLALAASTGPLAAQEYRAKVQGYVTDPSKAGVAAAEVILKNQGTGIATTRKTNERGLYIFDLVQPGSYTITAEAPGFNKFLLADILVQTRADLTVNAPLTLGSVASSVEVTAASTTVEFNSGSMSGTINGKLLDQMPVISRSPFALAIMEPSVVNKYGNATMDTSQNFPFYQISQNGMDIGGATGGKNQLLLDGVDTRVEQRGSYAPPMDAVQEVVVQQNPVDAEYGNSGGSAISISLKSGTNDLRGSAYYYGRNPVLNAVPNAITRKPSNARNHIFGTALGGPVVIPKVFNGKNKAFWFFSYEQWKASQSGGMETATLPTSLERAGDYSQSRNMYGALRTIYDPVTTVTNAATNTATRVPFPGNRIPTSRIDPAAAALMKYVWQPNGPGDNPLTGANNWKASPSIGNPYTNISTRGDYNINQSWRVFGRYSRQNQWQTPELTVDSPAYMSWGAGKMYAMNVAANVDGTLSPTTVVSLRFGYIRSADSLDLPSAKTNPETWNSIWQNNDWWRQSLSANSDVYFPAFSVGGSAFGNPSSWDLQPRQTSWSAMLIKQAGSHYVKFGGKLSHYSSDSGLPDWGAFNFDGGLTSSTYINAPTDVSGDSWASFLLGYPNSGYTNYASRVWTVSNHFGLFFQDDWKLTRNLTVNLGVRWEYDQAPMEKNYRLVRNLDLSSPIPEFKTTPPVFPATTAYGGFPYRFNGALQFLDDQNPRMFHAPKDVLLPRIGLAYRVNDKTSVRLGYARYAIPFQTALGPNWNLPNSGFSQKTEILAPIAGVPQTELSNPFPASSNPVLKPIGNSMGRYSQLGSAVVHYNQYPKQPINDRINLTLQRELPWQIRLDVTGFLSFGRNVPNADVYGGVVANQLVNMMNPALNYTYKAELSQAVANPFYQYLTPSQFPGSLRYQKTVSLASLLKPYPQYGAITEMYTGGADDRYRSLQIKAQKAFAHGLTFSAGYNYGRSLSDQYFSDVARYARQYTLTDTGAFRHKLTAAPVWEFPFGKGRRFANALHPVLEAILGGWTTSHLFQFNSGNMLKFGQMKVNGNPTIGNPSRDRWFNTQAFAPDNAYTLRSNPFYYDGLTGPASWNLDSTVAKNFQVTERTRLELRMDVFNVPNHFLSTAPVLDVRSSLFGRSVGQSNIGREMQYTLRLHF
ncbi:MAG TPA: TonB-dependent receptor [Bryobacteraceae bacterium]|nr:TonB-dependent receptor [Bryobacteraceae bacterium]